jgi:hypothetical protein
LALDFARLKNFVMHLPQCVSPRGLTPPLNHLIFPRMSILIYRRVRVFASAFLAFALLLTGGCTTFNHDWNQAAREPAPVNGIQGRWQGVWVSEVTHHTDSLRCVITKSDDGAYRARFKARYHHVLTFGYTVPLKVEPARNGFSFSGEADLGWLAGGVYHYEGQAEATNYFSTYSCKYDHGTFQMSRP